MLEEKRTGSRQDMFFASNGCPETSAMCSMATELARGKTIAKAKKKASKKSPRFLKHL